MHYYHLRPLDMTFFVDIVSLCDLEVFSDFLEFSKISISLNGMYLHFCILNLFDYVINLILEVPHTHRKAHRHTDTHTQFPYY